MDLEREAAKPRARAMRGRGEGEGSLLCRRCVDSEVLSSQWQLSAALELGAEAGGAAATFEARVCLVVCAWVGVGVGVCVNGPRSWAKGGHSPVSSGSLLTAAIAASDYMISAGGTGLSWIPVPTKLFQDRGWVFGSTICACKCRMGLVLHTAAVSGITLCIREQAHQHVGLAASRGQHHCQFHQLPLAEIIKFFAIPRLWAFRRKRARGDNHNKNFSLAHQNSAVCQQHDPSSAYNSKRYRAIMEMTMPLKLIAAIAAFATCRFEIPKHNYNYLHSTTATTFHLPPAFPTYQQFFAPRTHEHHPTSRSTSQQIFQTLDICDHYRFPAEQMAVQALFLSALCFTPLHRNVKQHPQVMRLTIFAMQGEMAHSFFLSGGAKSRLERTTC